MAINHLQAFDLHNGERRNQILFQTWLREVPLSVQRGYLQIYYSMKNKPQKLLQLHSAKDEPSHGTRGKEQIITTCFLKNQKAVSKSQLLNQRLTCTSILVLSITLLKEIFIKQAGTPFSRQKINRVFLCLLY